jgi:hypothetical protein
MKTIKNQVSLLLLMAIFIGVFYGCKKDGSGSFSNSTDILVVDEYNNPVPNATISSNNENSVQTNTAGIATIDNLTLSYGKYRISVSKEGYFPGSINIEKDSINAKHKVILLASTVAGTISSSGGTITGENYTVSSSGGFTNINGTPVTCDSIEIAVRYIEPDSVAAARKAFPGGDEADVLNGGGGSGQGGYDYDKNALLVYGWVAISYTCNGNIVYPAPGSVSIKVDVPEKYANAVRLGGINSFYFDEQAQVWETSGYVSASGMTVTMSLPSKSTFATFGKVWKIIEVKVKTKSTCEDGYLFGLASMDSASYSPQAIGTALHHAVVNLLIIEEWENYQVYHFYEGDHILKFRKREVSTSKESIIGPLTFSFHTDTIIDIGCIDNTPTGTFTYDGKTYSGKTSSVQKISNCEKGIDVYISPLVEETLCLILNMPEQSSGSFSFTSQITSEDCDLRCVFYLKDNPYIIVTSGTLTKTGARKFTFTGISEEGKTITGSGEY